jgi:AraC-like DNA-binding protein
MPFVGLTRSGIVSPIAAFLGRIGAPVERLLAGAGLPEWVLDDSEVLIPTASTARLLVQAARTQGIGNLGLLSGEAARIEALGVFGRLICRAPTLACALDLETSYHPLFSSSGRMWLSTDGESVRLCHAFTGPFDQEWQQADHYVLMLMLGVLRLGAGRGWRPTEVQLQTPECPALRDVEALSGARVSFGQPATAVTFPRALLDTPLRPSRIDGAAPNPPLDKWRGSAPAGDFAGSIVQVIEMLSGEGYPHIGLTADVLGMSVRSLQRHLAAAGLTHVSLVARARLATAAALLEETDAKILDIALDLGYSDHAHFTRAFRRWTGRSPQAFRRECRRRRDVSEPPAA